MEKKRCAACRRTFYSRPQHPNQTYCPAPDCQRKRRSRWQQHKRYSDQDYRENQRQAQKSWCQHNPDYWRQYHQKAHQIMSANANNNHTAQKILAPSGGVKMDVSNGILPFISGIYRLSALAEDESAKMDVWIVKLTFLSMG